MKNLEVVLYVDDEPINLRLFEIMFHGIYEILTFESGEDALKVIQDHPTIKAVITDMKMPVMDGLEFIELARKVNNNIPYYLLSGYGLTPEINEAIKKNLLNGYFQKPFKKSTIINELSKI